MKEQLTEEQYQKACEHLEFIQEEKEKLEKLHKTGEYNAHFDFPESFAELIINVLRETKKLDYQLKMEQKRFLQALPISKELREKLEEKLDDWIECLKEKEESTTIKKEADLTPLFNHYPSFEQFSEEAIEIIQKRQANNYILDYCTTLQEEQITCNEIKHNYEKKQRKQYKKRYFNNKKTSN